MKKNIRPEGQRDGEDARDVGMKDDTRKESS